MRLRPIQKQHQKPLPNTMNSSINVSLKTQRQKKYVHFLKILNQIKLRTEEASERVETLTEKEIKETIVKLQNNESPGTDGFAGEQSTR